MASTPIPFNTDPSLVTNMSAEASSVEIAPSELGFHRPFTVEVAETLTIRNLNPTPVAFKVKTTAPKQYCVRPNSGRIEPDRSVDVTVLLQAMKQDPPADYKCRDKFLVQSVPITGDKEFTTVQEIWDNVEKSAIQEKKIRVTFLTAEGATDPDAITATPSRPTTAPHEHDGSPDVSPPPTYASPHDGIKGINGSSIIAAAVTPSKPEIKNVLDQPRGRSPQAAAVRSVESPSAASAASSVAFSGATSPSTSADTKEAAIASLKAKLAEAEALNASLQRESGLRQRKVAGASEAASGSTAATAADVATAQLDQTIRQGTEGVPIQVTALLCLVSFLLAYLFF